MGTLDAHLIAFDAKDGKVLWDKEVADPAFGYSITHAPLIIGDNVIVGVSGGEYGIRGNVTAYNAMTGDQVWRWYSIPAPKGDSTFDDKAPNGWFGTWAPKAEGRRPAPGPRPRRRATAPSTPTPGRRGGGGVWMTPAYDKESNTHLPGRGQSVARPRRQHPPGRQPLHRLRRRHRRHLGQDQVVLPDGAARRLGPRRRVAAGRRDRRAARRWWCTPARPAGCTCSTPRPASWSARATPSCRRRTCSPCRPTRAPACCPAPTAARSGRRSRSIPTLSYAFVAALHQPMNYIVHTAPVREGPPLARLRLRGDPGRGAVRPLLRGRPQDRQDRLAEQGGRSR